MKAVGCLVSLTFPSNLPFCQQRELGQRRALTYHHAARGRPAQQLSKPVS